MRASIQLQAHRAAARQLVVRMRVLLLALAGARFVQDEAEAAHSELLPGTAEDFVAQGPLLI